METVPTSKLVRYFLYATVINFCAAIVFTVPVVVPEYTFPLELTVWPGTWMFEAYFAFLIVGVLGNLGWGELLDLLTRNLDKEESGRYLAFAHISLSNLAVYGATGLMFALGYLGGAAALIGFGRAVITQSIIGWMVVPIGVFIYLYLIGSILGVANLVWMLGRSKRSRTVAPVQASSHRYKDLIFWGGLIAAVSALFAYLPLVEIPYYPSNYLSEITILSISVIGLVAAGGIETYALIVRRHIGKPGALA